jgi:curli production assembly/transport component CsgG
MKKFIAIALSLILAGCAIDLQDDKRKELVTEAPVPIYKKRNNELVKLPPPSSDPIPVAVYKFSDLTGQRKPNDRFADFSTAVTQGSEVFMIKALQDAGQGKWFKVVERVNLDNLVKERQLIRSQREAYEGKEAKPLQPLIVAGIMIDGGIVGFDSNVVSGGIGARALGIGLSQQYRKDEVTVIVRLISINTGEVLLSTGVSKTVLSAGINGNVIKFLDQNTTSVEFEAGNSVNEPTTYAIRIAIEEAVVQIVREGIKRKLWGYKVEEKR